MKNRVEPSTQRVTVGLTSLEVMGPNPRRRAFLISPVAGGIAVATPVAGTIFNAGIGQTWTVPTSVTQLIAAYAWGSGGNADLPSGGLGSGGGGGAGFASSGPKTVIPGQVWTISVDTAGGAGNSSVTDPSLAVAANAKSGGNAVADVGGAAGTATVGATQQSGGAGAAATALAGAGGGGGAAGGTYANGAAGIASNGGFGGGGATLLGYGTGGSGSNGGATAMPGNNGLAPGGGAGGSGDTSAVIPTGANGLVVMLYVPADVPGYVSLSHKADVIAGEGVLNYITGQTFPTLITRRELGDAIGMPWFCISSIANVSFQILEILCEDDCDE